MTSHEAWIYTYFTPFSSKSLILQHLREVVPNANLLAFACLAFVFIDHLLVPAPLPAQRRITRLNDWMTCYQKDPCRATISDTDEPLSMS